MFRIETVASTTTIPKSHCLVRVPRKVHLGTLGVKHLRSLVAHRLTETEAVASTTHIPEPGCPIEELIREHLLSSVSQDLVFTEC